MSRTSGVALALLLSCASLSPAAAEVFIFTGTLSGDQEVPPVLTTTGTGNVVVTFDQDASTMRVEATWQDLLSPTTIAHIHITPEGVAFGPPATTVPTWPDFPVGVTSGSYEQTFNMLLASSYNPSFIAGNGGTTELAAAAFLDALLDGRAYFNIHTTEFPGGEIRANLNAIPEPGTWMLMLGGFALAGMALRRRRKELVPA